MATATTEAVDVRQGMYLSFMLGEEEYGLEIDKVQEIIRMMDVTRMPRTPEHIRGVINLRGRVIPVVDLRRKLGLDTASDTSLSCIIVSQLIRRGRPVPMGVVVDEVCDVLDIVSDRIQDPPALMSGGDSDFFIGVAKIDDRVVLLLDIERVLPEKEDGFASFGEK